MEKSKIYIRYRNALILIFSVFLANGFVYLQKDMGLNPAAIAVITMIFYKAVSYIWKNIEDFRDIRLSSGSIFMSLLFSMMMVTGRKINTGSREFLPFVFTDVILILFYFMAGFSLFSALFLFCEGKHTEKATTTKQKKGIQFNIWLKYAALLAIMWMPVFIIYYPGIIPGDATTSISMLMGEQAWTNHHPVFYTMIIGIFLGLGNLLGSINIGVALYSLCQLVVMALIIGYFLTWMWAKGVKRQYLYACIAYFSAMPLFGNYAIVMWKDPYFSGVLLLFALFLYDNAVEKRTGMLEKKNIAKYAVLVIFICLLRNNGIYIVGLVTMILVIVYRKELKKVGAVFILPVLTAVVITGPVYNFLIQAKSPFVESVGIPLQQMARVIVMNGEITEEQKQFMEELLPLEQYQKVYSPFSVDSVKWSAGFDNAYLESHKREFFRTWAGMFRNNLRLYTEQYLMSTYGFWHIGGDLDWEFVKVEIPENPWGIAQSYPVETYSGYCIQDEINSRYEYLPSGVMMWILLADFIICWIRRRWDCMIPLLIFAGNLATLLIAAPIAFGIRYMYVFVIGLPLLTVYPFLMPLVGSGIKNENRVN